MIHTSSLTFKHCYSGWGKFCPELNIQSWPGSNHGKIIFQNVWPFWSFFDSEGLRVETLVFLSTYLWPFRKEWPNSYFFLFLLFSIECKKLSRFKVYFRLFWGCFPTSFLFYNYSNLLQFWSSYQICAQIFSKGLEVTKNSQSSKEVCIKIKEHREDDRHQFLTWGKKKERGKKRKKKSVWHLI